MKAALLIAIFLLAAGCFAQTVNDLRPTVTMKEYVDMNVEWSQKYNIAQLAALKEANELVRLSLQEYKTVNNEWRGQLKDREGTYVTKMELILSVTTLLGFFWNYTRHMREIKAEGKNIQSGDRVEVKK